MNSNGEATSLTRSDQGLGFDPDALRAKYRAERDKRLRPDGNAQYIPMTGDFSHYHDDPYVAPGFTREPLTDEVEVLVVGGGFAGLSVGARLRLAGIEDVRFVEKAGDFGGTWYWNRYPGVQCDIESYVYLPLLEETGYIPQERYSHGPEIFEHARRVARHFDLYRDACFQTQVTELRWLEDEGRWLVSTDRDDRIKARYVVQTNGLLDRAKLPAIPGIDTYKGHTFHTSRWDYSYTGGDTTGGLDKLSDKSVALIGTGATGIQCTPYLGRYAKHLYVVQRTPSSVDERRNGPTDPEWVKSLVPGWQKRRRDNFVTLTSGGRADEDLVADGWTDIVRDLSVHADPSGDGAVSPQDLGHRAEMADFRKMNQIRARIESIVHDKATAEALMPWYRQYCKRPCFNDDYLPTFNRPSVTLVDTDGGGVERFTENGFVVGGREYEVDCIIFATGFEFGGGYLASARQKSHAIYGRGGKSLAEEWKNGVRTLHGFYSHDFPNLFHMGASQNGGSFAATYYLDEQALHIADVLQRARQTGATYIEPTHEAEAAWVAVIRSKGTAHQDFQRECTPGFYNDEGKVGERLGRLDEVYGGGPIEFYNLVRDWRAGDMDGLIFR